MVGKSKGGGYTTSDIDRILSDPNSKQNRITLILVRVGKEKLSALNSQEHTPVFIECRFISNRDLVSASNKVEIQDYREKKEQRELASRLTALFECTLREGECAYLKIPKWLEGGTTTTIIFFIILFLAREHTSIRNVKLGQLSVLDFPFYIMALSVVFAFASVVSKVTRVPDHLAKYLRTSGVFLWGGEIYDHKIRVNLYEKIIWGVGVALVVSIIASVIASLIS